MRLASILALSALLSTSVLAQKSDQPPKLQKPERFSAVALSTGGPETLPVATPVDIVVERWSTVDEAEKFRGAFKDGQQAALNVLMKFKPVGYIAEPGQLRWTFQWAQERVERDGTRTIFLATDRPMDFSENYYNTRSSEYPFTFLELRVRKDGKGEGSISRATKLLSDTDGRYVAGENYEPQPVKLTQVKIKS